MRLSSLDYSYDLVLKSDQMYILLILQKIKNADGWDSNPRSIGP
jgi:hypothetical protein